MVLVLLIALLLNSAENSPAANRALGNFGENVSQATAEVTTAQVVPA